MYILRGRTANREQMNGLKFYELKKEEKTENFFKKESEIQ